MRSACTRVAAVVALLVLSSLILPSRAAAGEERDPALQAVIEKFDAAQARIQRISATFREVKHIALLKEPVVQSGEFFHTKPDKFLWEYTKPEPKKLLLNGKNIVAYYPLEKRAEEIKTRFTKRIIEYLGLGSVLSELEDEYSMSFGEPNDLPGTDLIELTPKQRRIAKRLSKIRIWLDHKLSQPRQIEYIEADGDSSKITFSQININPEIELTKYEIKIPDDFKVTNSISGLFAASSQ
ncbi:MAG TPA: outer membrane lipoprotein carrier protein LolA [Candidatus Saccharimonadales bacterium]|nr:outer membrane lipoprotein carrier protein LolA [Candidatus Saccharimonadales bacterium]